MGAMCVSSASPVRFWIFMLMLQGNFKFYEMIHGGSPLELRAFDLSTSFGLFLFGEAWAYQLKKFFARRTRVCGLIMPGQGKFYHGVSLMQCETYISCLAAV